MAKDNKEFKTVVFTADRMIMFKGVTYKPRDIAEFTAEDANYLIDKLFCEEMKPVKK